MLVVVVAAIVVSRIAFQAYALSFARLRGCPREAWLSVDSNGAIIVTGDTIASAKHGGSFVSTHRAAISVGGAPGLPHAQPPEPFAR